MALNSHPELVALDAESCVATASRLAGDLEKLYRGMWAGWCAAARRD
jgi:hypothetical protein